VTVTGVPLESGPSVDDVATLLEQDGAVVVRGVDVRDDAALLAVAGLAGEPSSVGNAGHLIFDVTPRPDGTDLSSTGARFPLHTDSTFLPEPHAAVALGCARAASSGGASFVVRARDVCDRLDDAALAALAETAYPFIMRDGEQPARVELQPVLTAGAGGGPAVRYRGDVVEMAARASGVELEERHRAALDAMAAVLEDEALRATFALGTGDVLLLDNRHALHGRSAIDGDPGDDERRLVRRIKLDARVRSGPAAPTTQAP
jgi:alpha-ketoglutarate-dependent taurine dioxygenase